MFIFILKGMQKLEQLSVFGGIVIISSLVVVSLMGVETTLAALKVSQSPYRGVSEHFTGTRKSISLWRCAMPKVEVP